MGEDLKKASSDPNINWIIVYYHKTAYTSPSIARPLTEIQPFTEFRDLYHPLFDKYHVDLVLQGHEHNYQRSHPLKYNINNSSNPIITDTDTHNYTNPQGRIFVIVGTAGAHFFKLLGQAHYIATQFTGIHGFLNIDVKGATTLNAKFYSNDGSIKDQFTITKKSQ